ncbi:hypothetical protein K505DRAFT_327715 [Melanomma pulvis-pyrius CBS 109.77]|uniref:Uncharacterized protein n=1 Tax=Melanomma pulvis-pyrius CBS 109.77 TaxID=1314802 RepID=A0A6A6X250_9PLEO|nr:hypothetical protein K505DRAFT_327715 [Melanomma pulvis-pyrius CBS 109.77]
MSGTRQSQGGQGVAAGSGGPNRATGMTGGQHDKHLCINANMEGHPPEYRFHQYANRLCFHCRSAMPPARS